MFGAITHQIDAVEVLVCVFFLYFAGLIVYLRREDKREGYPLDDDGRRRGPVEGFPATPPSKSFRLLEGDSAAMPHHYPEARDAAESGDPLRSGLGAAAYPLRRDEPMLVLGEPQLQPLARAAGWQVAHGDPDPRGMRVVDAERAPVGVVRELWIDRGAKLLRYLEVDVAAGSGDRGAGAAAGERRLLPIYYADIDARRRVIRVRALLAREFAAVPRPVRGDRITAREEDRLNAFYSGAALYGGARR